MATCMPNVLKLRIMALGAWYDGDIYVWPFTSCSINLRALLSKGADSPFLRTTLKNRVDDPVLLQRVQTHRGPFRLAVPRGKIGC